MVVAYRTSPKHWLSRWTQGLPRPEGEKAVAAATVSFGRVPPRYMHGLHHAIYHRCAGGIGAPPRIAEEAGGSGGGGSGGGGAAGGDVVAEAEGVAGGGGRRWTTLICGW